MINFVRYELRPMVADPAYAELYRASGIDGGLPYEGGRVELVRTELSPAGEPILTTREIISEYAVDLQFTAVQATSNASGKSHSAKAAPRDGATAKYKAA